MTLLDLLLLPIRLPFWLLVKWIEWSLQSETFERVKCAFFMTLFGLAILEGVCSPTRHPKAETAAIPPAGFVQRDDNRSGPPPQAWQSTPFPGGQVLHNSNGDHVTCQELPGWSNWVRCFGDR